MMDLKIRSVREAGAAEDSACLARLKDFDSSSTLGA